MNMQKKYFSLRLLLVASLALGASDLLAASKDKKNKKQQSSKPQKTLASSDTNLETEKSDNQTNVRENVDTVLAEDTSRKVEDQNYDNIHLKGQVILLDKKNNELEKALSEANNQLGEAKREQDNLSAIQNKLQAELAEARKNDKTQEVAQLKEQLNQIENEKKSTANKLEDLESRIEEYTKLGSIQEVQDMITSREELRAENRELVQKASELDKFQKLIAIEKLEVLLTEHGQLSVEVLELQKSKTALEAELQNTKDSVNTDSQVLIDTIKVELEDIKDTLSKKMAEKLALENELASEKHKLKELTDRYTAINAGLNNDLTSAKAALAPVQKAMEQYKFQRNLAIGGGSVSVAGLIAYINREAIASNARAGKNAVQKWWNTKAAKAKKA